MNPINIKTVGKKYNISPLPSKKERILVWAKVKGIWKNKKPDPIKELQEMRKEWGRSS